MKSDALLLERGTVEVGKLHQRADDEGSGQPNASDKPRPRPIENRIDPARIDATDRCVAFHVSPLLKPVAEPTDKNAVVAIACERGLRLPRAHS